MFHLLENLKPVVLSLKIVGKEREKPTLYACACGFCVSNGYIITCASIFTDVDFNKMKIRARRLGQNIFLKVMLNSVRPQ